jgi:diadenosine tetraphosphate (Ap4A) HIT family hydrolase
MSGLVPGCYSCDQQAAATLPPREDVVRTAHWRVVHAFNTTLPGWLVLLPSRHVLSFTQLSPEAADERDELALALRAAYAEV